MFWLTSVNSRNKKKILMSGNDRGKVVSAVSSFTASPKVNSSAHDGEQEREGQVRGAEFHSVQLLHSGSQYTV